MNKRIKVAAASLAVVGALIAGSFTGVAIAAASAPAPDESSAVPLLNSFRENDQGLTYGFVDQGLAKDPNARADLIAVTTDDGRDGWAYSAEFMPWITIDNPEQARSFAADQSYSVAIYELDGKTLIGYHTVNRPVEK